MMTTYPPFRKIGMIALVMTATLTLPSCVNFGGPAPSSMLTLKSTSTIADATSKSGLAKDAMVILIPDVPRQLDTNRVLVQMATGSIAYIKNGVWADKPAALMQQLLTETIAARNGILILTEVETSGKAEQYLSAQLVDFGIDESDMVAIATLDAVRIRKGQPIEKRRFQARASVSTIESAVAGAALNEAANKVASDVSDWLRTP